MNVDHASLFKDCYVMQRGDIERFADTLADAVCNASPKE